MMTNRMTPIQRVPDSDATMQPEVPLVRSEFDRSAIVRLMICLLAILFGAASIHQSQRYGQLSVPATYDDIVYYVDAMNRLKGLYERGFTDLLSGLFADPPHSPVSTAVVMTAFATLGIHQWAPPVLNIVFIVIVLAMTDACLRKAGAVCRVLAAIAILTWPFFGFLVIETRPDFVAAIATAFGLTRLVGGRWVGSSRSHVALVVACMSVALLAKPSISPVTLSLFGFAMICATLIDPDSLSASRLGASIRWNLGVLAIVLLLIAPYYAVAGREIFDYIYLTTFGKEKGLWAYQLTFSQHLAYYFVGEGGLATMGPWVYVAAITIIAATLRRVRSGSLDRRRAGAAVAVFVAAWLVVSIPAHKSPSLGAVVSALMLFAFCWGLADLLCACSRRLGIALCTVIALAGITAFQWHWFHRTGGDLLRYGRTIAPAAAPGEGSARRAAIDELVQRIAQARGTSPIVYFPVFTQYLNSDILKFAFQTHDLPVTVVDQHRSGQRAEHDAMLDLATHVVLFDPQDPDVMRWLPSYALYPKLREDILASGGFRRTGRIPTGGRHGASFVEVLARKGPFDLIDPGTGFGQQEGPYPASGLGVVMWGIGDSSELRLKHVDQGKSSLRIVAQAPMAGQTIRIRPAAGPWTDCALEIAGKSVTCEVALSSAVEGGNVRLEYAKVLPPTAADARRLSVLFQEISVIPAPSPPQ